jgi:hypothetical protein
VFLEKGLDMPKLKTTPKRKTRSSKSAARKKPVIKPQALIRAKPTKPALEQNEYQQYLQRFARSGAGRRRLGPKEFDDLDDKLLDLYAQEAITRLDLEQSVLRQELEYLLILSET